MSAHESAPLTPAQRDLMEIVWAEGEVTVSEVRDLLEAKRNLARNTVLTMMVRLEERGWLQHRTQGRTFVYSAARPKTVSLGMRVSQMVDRLFAGSPEDLVTALIEYRGLTAAETRRIRSMIEQAEAKQKQSGQRRKNQS
ncbi:BlaI/MecI/CopY family transcriptional regulator [Gimesia maris]|uniref:Penicillinase repressor n=1 Tax=Gimesia maris TaxID=122 RepID=A0ABX5YUA5_9PLAN|nr:BlaI/MecI/CopY family transcriptional regulator [Gimesia maris]HAW31954.1 BlaI/MecI/CopY family transcriptional regulator [Planctomycetaceae bacterium]EDL58616.1 probable Penicillinase repressor [Gimesia maris DSM 8797]QDU17322.1 Penicillinase repressor [Gimesia maris]QEG19384.1 Penicillinase repressor [Gimesia maris]QGQ27753.1 BlaI/MecI/CopY family transcriptional regulator [Gimesia maris]|tara:strand:+ start:340 stop:759 length:420 start_codon:yes stop_codon:yes gene_type:complete